MSTFIENTEHYVSVDCAFMGNYPVRVYRFLQSRRRTIYLKKVTRRENNKKKNFLLYVCMYNGIITT